VHLKDMQFGGIQINRIVSNEDLLLAVLNLQALIQDSNQPKYVTHDLTQEQFKAVCISDHVSNIRFMCTSKFLHFRRSYIALFAM